MKQDKFDLSWITQRENYDNNSRSSLLNDFLINSKDRINNIIDLGCGTGSFLRWCFKNKININKIIMIDHNKKLLNQAPVIFAKYFREKNFLFNKFSRRRFEIENISKTKNVEIILKEDDISSALQKINQYNIISLSAIADLLSKTFIRKLLNKISSNKLIYFSICFNGIIKWNPTNKFDKYIINNFNRHQKQDKGTGLALGSECVKYIKSYSQKKKYKCLKKDSSWFIKSNKQLDQIFQHQYIKTIIKALKEDDITDRNILKEWHAERTKKIESKKSNLVVKHDDILIIT